MGMDSVRCNVVGLYYSKDSEGCAFLGVCSTLWKTKTHNTQQRSSHDSFLLHIRLLGSRIFLVL